MAKDVHQQSVGTRTGIKFLPASTLIGRQRSSISSMNFFQTFSPGGICLHRFVASLQKISVPCAVFTRWKTHDRAFAVAQRMRQGFGQRKLPGPLGQIVTEGSSQAHANSMTSGIIANKI